MDRPLKSFGCSFVFGTELPDCVPENNSEPSCLTYPALIASNLGLAYSCRAKGGTGNLDIMHQILTGIAKRQNQDQNLWIINWTYIDRFDYDLGRTLLPGDKDGLARLYYRDLQHDFADKMRSLSYIYTAITALTAEKIPYLMTAMDPLLFDSEHDCRPSMLFLQQQIQPHITTFEGTDFLTWSQRHGHALGALGHPLQDAHAAAAEYLMPVIESSLHKV